MYVAACTFLDLEVINLDLPRFRGHKLGHKSRKINSSQMYFLGVSVDILPPTLSGRRLRTNIKLSLSQISPQLAELPMLAYRWATVVDGGPTMSRYCISHFLLNEQYTQ